MIETPIETELKCYHCGDNCRNHDTRHYLPYTDETLFFCCQGCLTVYSILNQNDLCAYYDFQKNPGQKMNSSSSKFNHLKAEAIADRLLTFKSETLNVVKLNVPGIHCTSCIWLLENLAKLNEGIIKTEVNFHKRQVTVSYNPLHIQLDKLVQLMASIGY